MQSYKISTSKFRLDLSRDELIVISNYMNEAMNALCVEEFSTRIGSEMKDVETLHDQILSALDTPE